MEKNTFCGYSISWFDDCKTLHKYFISLYRWKWQTKVLSNINFSIVNQSNCYQMYYRISKFVTISSDMGDTGINVILWPNIRKKRISVWEGISFRRYLISEFCSFETFHGYKMSWKWSKVTKIKRFNTPKI